MNLSGGAASAAAWLRLLKRHPDALAVFADTNSEDPDLYRFLADVDRHTNRPCHRLTNQGQTTWDVFHRQQMIKNRNACFAASHLKQIPLDNFARSLTPDPTAITIYTGLSPDEDDRIARLTRRLSPRHHDTPLSWPPLAGKCTIARELDAAGLKPPALYDLGYPHNNCGGCCVLAGIANWTRTLAAFPDRYAHAEKQEAQFQADLTAAGRPSWTILRDRRNGTTQPYPLSALRADITAGRRPPIDPTDHEPCNCAQFLF